MLRATTKKADGTYTSDMSREDLLKLLGELEDKGLVSSTQGKVGDRCYVSIRTEGKPGFKVTMGTIAKVLNSKKDGIRYDVMLTITRNGNTHSFTPRFPADCVFGTPEEAQKRVELDIAEAERFERHQRFVEKLWDAYNDKTITIEIATTEEEKLWLRQWQIEACISERVDRLLYQFNSCTDQFSYFAKHAEDMPLENLVGRIMRAMENYKDLEQAAFRINHYAVAFDADINIEIPNISGYIQKIKPSRRYSRS